MERYLKNFLLFLIIGLSSNAQVSTSYLWHLQQPIYWPDAQAGSYHYQVVKQSQDMKDAGGNQLKMLTV